MVLLLCGSSLVQTYSRQIGRFTTHTLRQLLVDMLRTATGNGTGGQEQCRSHRELHCQIKKSCRLVSCGLRGQALTLYEGKDAIAKDYSAG